MKVEFTIQGGNQILLTPIKRTNETNGDKIYELLDDDNAAWMELRLDNNVFEIIFKDQLIEDSSDDIEIKLNTLMLQIIEAEQIGIENTDTANSLDILPYDSDKIKVQSKQFSIKLIEEMIDNEDIVLAPDFQRNFVWTSVQKSRLIESILLRIPLPMFYFSEDEEGKISVVDGLQRLTTIKEFIDNKFPLKSLEYLKDSCEGRYYSNKDKQGNVNGKKAIDPKYFRWFNMTQFSVNVIDPSSPSKVKYDIFRRINTGGKPLNNQEIRNSLAAKELRDILKKMTISPEFLNATDRSIKPTRMDDQEVALRFILFNKLFEESKSVSQYNGYMDSSLDSLTESLSKNTNQTILHYSDEFINAMKNAKYLFGQKYAFRKVMPRDLTPSAYKQLINKVLFVSWSVLLSKYDNEKIKLLNPEKALLEPLANEIQNDTKFFNFLSFGTNSKANIVYVFQKVESIIATHLKY